MATKVAIFFSSATVAGAFSELNSSSQFLTFSLDFRWSSRRCDSQYGWYRWETWYVVLLGVEESVSHDFIAWAWIFILEGSVTVVIGLISYFVIQDFPDTAKFLNEKERMCYHGFPQVIQPS
jgi:hypothetical protein